MREKFNFFEEVELLHTGRFIDMELIVLGCGVSGLTSGIRLLEEGFQVKIVAHELPPYTTSNTAAAIWYPYKAYPEVRVLEWGEFSYQKFNELSQIEASGVYFVELMELFDKKVGDPWWIDAVRSFRHANTDELPKHCVDGYVVEVPLIETPIYMNFLMEKFKKLGGTIEQVAEKISALTDLTSKTNLLINCSGIGAKQVCNDSSVFPIRGQIIRTTNPGIKRSFVDEGSAFALAYVVARKDDCILGGTAQEGNWELQSDLETADEIFRKCKQVFPTLEKATILEHKVGLRPGRKEIRLEMESAELDECQIIHNYGHGGAGFTLSWGCAEEVVALAKDIGGNG